MTESPALPGKQRRKSLAARRKICEATIGCLARQGYHRTSIARVVDSAGVTPGALQHHFPTKEDLIVAAADHLLEGSMERTRRYAVSQRDPAAVLPDFLRSMWTNLMNTEQYRALLEVLVAARTDRRLRARVTPTLHRWNRAIDGVVVEIFESVGRGNEDVETIMLMTRSLMRGLVLQEGYGDAEGAAHRAVERWIEMVEPLLRLREPSGAQGGAPPVEE
jgi:AcrR family transcriptional regulator